MNKRGLALNDQQWLMYYKTKLEHSELFLAYSLGSVYIV